MLNNGIIIGLMVMACWGLADFIQSFPIRKLGTPKTMFVRNVLILVLILPFAVYLYINNQIAISTTGLLIISVSSFIYVLGYYMFMRGFEFGNLSLVSPISGSYSIITVMLALLFLNESLSLVQLIAVFIMIAGVFFTSTDISKLKSIKSQIGLKEALLAALGFGVSLFILGFASKQMDSMVIFIFATITQAVFFLIVSIIKRGIITKKDLDLKLSSVFIIHAIIANIGWFLYITGVGKNSVSLVTPISSLYPGITVLFALIIYRERLVMNQKFGIIGILVGVLLISM